MHTFNSYQEWHGAITGPCGLTLTQVYCEERIAALMDENAPGTKPFIDTYGSDYRDQVIIWFRQLALAMVYSPLRPRARQPSNSRAHLEPPVMSEDRLRQWLLGLPRDILRVKGLVRISDQEMCYFNRTDDPFEAPRIIKVRAQEGMEPAAVFIGSGLKQEFLEASFTTNARAIAFKLT